MTTGPGRKERNNLEVFTYRTPIREAGTSAETNWVDQTFLEENFKALRAKHKEETAHLGASVAERVTMGATVKGNSTSAITVARKVIENSSATLSTDFHLELARV